MLAFVFLVFLEFGLEKFSKIGNEGSETIHNCHSSLILPPRPPVETAPAPAEPPGDACSPP